MRARWHPFWEADSPSRLILAIEAETRRIQERGAAFDKIRPQVLRAEQFAARTFACFFLATNGVTQPS